MYKVVIDGETYQNSAKEVFVGTHQDCVLYMKSQGYPEHLDIIGPSGRFASWKMI